MKINKIIETEVDIDITGATLLSIEEAESLLTKEEREYNCWWWLRSPGDDRYSAACVSYYGSVSCIGIYVNYDSGCVLPALKISNLESSNLNIGDTFIFGEKKFKVISDALAFCLEDIGIHCFRRDWRAEDANDYEKSDVKKFVDKWFEESCR